MGKVWEKSYTKQDETSMQEWKWIMNKPFGWKWPPFVYTNKVKVHYEDINENHWMKQKTTTLSILKIQN